MLLFLSIILRSEVQNEGTLGRFVAFLLVGCVHIQHVAYREYMMLYPLFKMLSFLITKK